MLTERTRTDLKSVITIVTVALAVAAIGAVARVADAKADASASVNDHQQVEITTLKIQDAKNSEAHERIEDKQEAMDKKLDRILEKLDTKK